MVFRTRLQAASEMSSREESGEAAIAVRNAGGQVNPCGAAQEDFLEVAIRDRAAHMTTTSPTCQTRKMTT